MSKAYQIYLLRNNRYVFVGKSVDQRIQSIQWRHQRGENRRTCKYFSKSDAPNLELYTLVTVQGDHQEAHRYVLAFIRLLLNANYIVLNSEKTIQEALVLDRTAERLLGILELPPLSVRLGEESAPNALSSAPDKPAARIRASENLSVRLYPDELTFCKINAAALSVSLHTFLAILMDTFQKYKEEYPEQNFADHMSLHLHSLEERIEQKNQEIASLKEELKQLKAHYKEAIQNQDSLFRQGLQNYLHHFDPVHSDAEPFPILLFRNLWKKVDDLSLYRYPTKEDFFVFYPEDVFYSKSVTYTKFLIGHDASGRKTLLRFYPKKHYIGPHITNPRFGRRGSCWLVRAKRAADQAMDIIFSLPLDVVPNRDHLAAENPITGLDKTIADAILRSEGIF